MFLVNLSKINEKKYGLKGPWCNISTSWKLIKLTVHIFYTCYCPIIYIAIKDARHYTSLSSLLCFVHLALILFVILNYKPLLCSIFAPWYQNSSHSTSNCFISLSVEHLNLHYMLSFSANFLPITFIWFLALLISTRWSSNNLYWGILFWISAVKLSWPMWINRVLKQTLDLIRLHLETQIFTSHTASTCH